MTYRFLHGNNTKNAAVVQVPDDLDDIAFFDDMETRSSLNGWQTIVAEARPFRSSKSAALLDWSPSDLLPRLCSKKLMQVIAPFSDRLVWLPVSVRNGETIADYFIMHFVDFPDVLDATKSEYIAGRLFCPHLSLSKAKGLTVFSLGPLELSAIVTSDVEAAILESGCTGIEFQSIACS